MLNDLVHKDKGILQISKRRIPAIYIGFLSLAKPQDALRRGRGQGVFSSRCKVPCRLVFDHPLGSYQCYITKGDPSPAWGQKFVAQFSPLGRVFVAQFVVVVVVVVVATGVLFHFLGPC